MKIKLQNSIRYIVILASLIIFCYQFNTALLHLIGKETVDSTEYIPLSDAKSLPVITICPRQGQDFTRLNEWGYYTIDYLLYGNIFDIKKL